MKNVKTLLIFITISTFIYASGTRVNALGGGGFWAEDYANITACEGAQLHLDDCAGISDHQEGPESGNAVGFCMWITGLDQGAMGPVCGEDCDEGCFDSQKAG